MFLLVFLFGVANLMAIIYYSIKFTNCLHTLGCSAAGSPCCWVLNPREMVGLASSTSTTSLSCDRPNKCSSIGPLFSGLLVECCKTFVNAFPCIHWHRPMCFFTSRHGIWIVLVVILRVWIVSSRLVHSAYHRPLNGTGSMRWHTVGFGECYVQR